MHHEVFIDNVGIGFVVVVISTTHAYWALSSKAKNKLAIAQTLKEVC